ncbi:MAG TPA: hypothetical protein VML54_16435, partial [Candidatus Limnocylindrales bacterium]|nr:hypothetical protein [Candidatus Limnocylindrales bacterium]
MDLATLLTRSAPLEKRALVFYRELAERFAAHAEAARLWREMSNTEASHFALLQLAEDWVTMAGARDQETGVTSEDFDALGAALTAIEDAAARADCGLAEAAELTVRWEELELPRVVRLAGELPGTARGRVMAGMIGEAEEHFRMLGELIRVAGAPALAERA